MHLRPDSSIQYGTTSCCEIRGSTGPELAAVRLISGCKSLNSRLNRRADWRADRGGSVVSLAHVSR